MHKRTAHRKYVQHKAYKTFHSKRKIDWLNFAIGWIWACAFAGMLLLYFGNKIDNEQTKELINPVIVKGWKLDTSTHITEIKVETITPEPTPTPTKKHYTAPHSEIRDYVDHVFAQHSDMAHRILQCESNWNPNAANPRSTARGLWQIINSTWIENRKAMGRSTDLDLRFDYKEATDTAYFIFLHRNWQPWECIHKI